MKLLKTITTCIKRLLFSLLVVILSLIFLSGLSVSLDFNIDRAKSNLIDKGLKVIKVVGSVKKAIY